MQHPQTRIGRGSPIVCASERALDYAVPAARQLMHLRELEFCFGPFNLLGFPRTVEAPVSRRRRNRVNRAASSYFFRATQGEEESLASGVVTALVVGVDAGRTQDPVGSSGATVTERCLWATQPLRASIMSVIGISSRMAGRTAPAPSWAIGLKNSVPKTIARPLLT